MQRTFRDAFALDFTSLHFEFHFIHIGIITATVDTLDRYVGAGSSADVLFLASDRAKVIASPLHGARQGPTHFVCRARNHCRRPRDGVHVIVAFTLRPMRRAIWQLASM
jgi:hypothetical protein